MNVFVHRQGWRALNVWNLENLSNLLNPWNLSNLWNLSNPWNPWNPWNPLHATSPPSRSLYQFIRRVRYITMASTTNSPTEPASNA